MNTWMFHNNDIFLMSSDPQQLEIANQWIARLKEAIRYQVMEEVNGGTTNELDRNELPEVTC